MIERILDLLYPRRCALCDRLGTGSPCDECLTAFTPSAEPFRTRQRDLDFAKVLFAYEGRAGQAVRELKYSRRTSMANSLAVLMAKAAKEIEGPIDAAVPVPIHWSRWSRRGFNQSVLLCEAMPKEWVQPNWLRRIRATRPQVGLSHEERLTNLAGAFQARNVDGKRILLVDDVLTSGGTASECARALREAGAIEVGFLALCG